MQEARRRARHQRRRALLKSKRQNQLTDDHIAKIINTYQFRKDEPRYSRRVEMDTIGKNDFNLNISRNISTAIFEAEIDLAATHGELVEIKHDSNKNKEAQRISKRTWSALAAWGQLISSAW